MRDAIYYEHGNGAHIPCGRVEILRHIPNGVVIAAAGFYLSCNTAKPATSCNRIVMVVSEDAVT